MKLRMAFLVNVCSAALSSCSLELPRSSPDNAETTPEPGPSVVTEAKPDNDDLKQAHKAPPPTGDKSEPSAPTPGKTDDIKLPIGPTVMEIGIKPEVSAKLRGLFSGIPHGLQVPLGVRTRNSGGTVTLVEKPCKWNSDNPAVIKIDVQTGEATALARTGKANVTADCGDIKASAAIGAQPPVPVSIAISCSPSVKVLPASDESFGCGALVKLSDGTSDSTIPGLFWKSSDESVLTIQNDNAGGIGSAGRLWAHKTNGAAWITASWYATSEPVLVHTVP